jgi:hypothetical protein
MPTLGYIGERLDLLVKQGSTLGPFPVELKDSVGAAIDLTGCNIRGHIRRKALDTALVKSFNVVITDAAAGKFSFSLSDEETATIPAGEELKDRDSIYVWDMELEDSAGSVRPLYYGELKVFREVTRV